MHAACKDIYSAPVKNQKAFVKTKFQDIGEKELGITAERDPTRHREVRRLLNPGFGTRAVKEREHVLHEHIDRLIGQIRARGTIGQGVNMIDVRDFKPFSRLSSDRSLQWCDWLAWDLAGDMGYGRQFNNIRDGMPPRQLSVGFRRQC